MVLLRTFLRGGPTPAAGGFVRRGQKMLAAAVYFDKFEKTD